MNKAICTTVFIILSALLLVSCSLPPIHPVTRLDLNKAKVYNKYIIEESPEELLYALNTRGEVIVEAKRNIPGRDFPVYVKLMATPGGVHVNEYDR